MDVGRSADRKMLRIVPLQAQGSDVVVFREHRRLAAHRYHLGEVDITKLLWRLGVAKRGGRTA